MRTPIIQLEKRELRIRKLLQKPPNRFGPEDFHRLRLEMKKMDSLFHLAGFVSNEFDRRKIYIPIRTAFSLAGKVRDWQLCEKWLSDLRNKPEANLLLKKVRRNKIEARRAFFQELKSVSSARLLKSVQAARKPLRAINSKEINSYLAHIQNRVRKLLKEKKEMQPDLHEIRKWLKISGYLRKCIPQKESLQVPEYMDLPVDLIGDWHDLQASANRIEQLLKTSDYPEKRKSGIRRLVTALRKKEHILLKKLMTRLSA